MPQFLKFKYLLTALTLTIIIASPVAFFSFDSLEDKDQKDTVLHAQTTATKEGDELISQPNSSYKQCSPFESQLLNAFSGLEAFIFKPVKSYREGVNDLNFSLSDVFNAAFDAYEHKPKVNLNCLGKYADLTQKLVDFIAVHESDEDDLHISLNINLDAQPGVEQIEQVIMLALASEFTFTVDLEEASNREVQPMLWLAFLDFLNHRTTYATVRTELTSLADKLTQSVVRNTEAYPSDGYKYVLLAGTNHESAYFHSAFTFLANYMSFKDMFGVVEDIWWNSRNDDLQLIINIFNQSISLGKESTYGNALLAQLLPVIDDFSVNFLSEFFEKVSVENSAKYHELVNHMAFSSLSTDKRLPWLEALLELEPENVRALTALLSYLSGDELRERTGELLQLITSHSLEGQFTEVLIQANQYIFDVDWANGDLTETLELLQQGLEQTDLDDIRLLRDLTLINLGREEEAIYSLESLYSANPNDPDIGNAYALALTRTGSIQVATRLYRDLLEEHQNDLTLSNNLATNLQAIGDYEQAESIFMDNLSNAETDEESYYALKNLALLQLEKANENRALIVDAKLKAKQYLEQIPIMNAVHQNEITSFLKILVEDDPSVRQSLVESHNNNYGSGERRMTGRYNEIVMKRIALTLDDISAELINNSFVK